MAFNMGAKFIIAAGVTGEQSIRRLNSTLRDTKEAGRGLVGSFGGARAALASFAAIATTGAIGLFVRNTIQLGDELLKLSQKTGVSVERLSQFEQAAKLADLEVGSLSTGFRDLAKFINEANKAGSREAKLFDALGLERGDDLAETMLKLADAFKQLPDGEVQSNVAREIGKSFGELVPLLNEGRAGVEKFSATVTTEFAESADKFGDTMAMLKSELQGLVVDIGPGLLETLQGVADAMRATFSDPQVREGIANTTESLLKLFGFVVTHGRELLAVFGAIAGAKFGASVGGLYGALAGALAGGGAGYFAPELLALATGADGAASSVNSLASEVEVLQGRLARVKKQLEDLKAGRLNVASGDVGAAIAERQALIASLEAQISAAQARAAPPPTGGGRPRVNAAGVAAAIKPEDTDALREAERAQREAEREAERAAKERERQVRKSAEALADFTAQMEVNRQQIELETDALNQNALQQRIAAAQYEIEAEKLKALTDARGEDIAEIERQAEAEKKRVAKLLEEQDRVAKSFSTGVGRALRGIAEIATDNAALIEQAISGAFSRAGDALAEFVTTGKLDFKNFVTSLLADFARLAAQRALAGAITAIFGGALGASGDGGGAGVSVGTQMAHTGGIAGSGSLTRKAVSPLVFAGAPRYHTGGIAGNEVPTILQRGEGVFTPEQMRALAPAGSGSNITINSTVNMQTGQMQTSTQGAGQQGEALNRQITAKIREVLIMEQRPGGILAA